ncbi:hypothetical protein AU468_12950 [Alkalispirochaeta sphaeroplastigenens]|uniref:Sodium:proton antiporter n=1 Tax=Alkalispirochaeta sphaeroplastigenens TaxID=1187066 RepID=A0A2S4JG09_9SPIO|nr:hypothetical protein [Alkalispirochaeta sphaeroplastigenens]POQ98494.1 hypothetical protein AU468_12950 [Alkalispirochaeta sphaeroplastigenens]
MRYFLSALLVLTVFAGVTAVGTLHQEQLEPSIFLYITSFFERDTAAHNAIAAILLNYRMYDTMFEALILLTAIIGMKQFLPTSRELRDADE